MPLTEPFLFATKHVCTMQNCTKQLEAVGNVNKTVSSSTEKPTTWLQSLEVGVPQVVLMMVFITIGILFVEVG
jgi:hypothetical protein